MNTSELDTAYENLTPEQMKQIDALRKQGHSISQIACKASLTRSYVHSYIRKLNAQ